MKASTSNAVGYCHRVGKPSDQCAKMLKKLFPAFSQSERPKFDPGKECVALAQKRKKKAANLRVKNRTITVVFLQKKSVFVPKGYMRRQLHKMGRIAKLQFRRNMTTEEVNSVLLHGFPQFADIKHAEFLRCGKDNKLCRNEEQELDGDGVFMLAGQGSMYLSQEAGKVNNEYNVLIKSIRVHLAIRSITTVNSCVLMYLWPSINFVVHYALLDVQLQH